MKTKWSTIITLILVLNFLFSAGGCASINEHAQKESTGTLAAETEGERTGSLAMRGTKILLRLSGKKLNDAEKMRSRYVGRTYPQPYPIPAALKKICDIHEERVDGQPVYTFVPKTGKSHTHIIYTHGGAYIKALRSAHWDIIRKLIEMTGSSVTVPIYPLAPEHIYKEAYAELEKVYLSVIAQMPAEYVILCGDSAGGGLALGQAMRYRDQGLPMPGRIILFFPWLDVTMSNPHARDVEKEDVMLAEPGLIIAGTWWAGGDDPRTPLISPLFGNLGHLPPIDVYQGTADILIADARKLKEEVEAAGGSIRLFEYPGAFHGFVAATFTPESRDAFSKIADTIPASHRAANLK